MRNPKKKTSILKYIDVMYGCRGVGPRVHFLSPFEFVRHWGVALVDYPKTISEIDSYCDHVTMTNNGLKKLRTKHDVALIAGED